MAGNVGRTDLLKKNDVVIAGVREKTITWGGEPIDVTSGEDNGFRRLLDANTADSIGQQQLSISLSGLIKGVNAFRGVAFNPAGSAVLTDITYEFDSGDEISGTVIVTSYEETAPYKDATTFSCSLEFTGIWVYTPAP